MLYYTIDSTIWAARNAAGEDYTPAYIPSMLAFMGMTGKKIAPDALSTLTKDDVVLLGTDCAIPATCAATCIRFGVPGAEAPTRRRHVYATYLAKNGYGIPLFVPVGTTDVAPDEILSYAEVDGTRTPALIRAGETYQFLFDLPATLWFSGDGFMEMQNDPYFPVGRTPDWRPLPNGQYGAQPYNDLLLLELEDILHELGIPSIYRLPPMQDGSVPDMVLHFSGDDDCCSATINRNAAARMKEVGFPYHINAMPNPAGEFCFDTAVLRELQENGCELGLHLDLTYPPYSAEHVKAQFEQFRAAFGLHPITNVNHCLVQHGTQAEFLRWLQACDIIADNGYLGTFNPDDINAFDLQEYGYGTSFPRFTCDDAAHGNAPLFPALIPITYYEARLPNEDSDPAKVIAYLDGAAAYGRITQFFFHPHYLNDDNVHCTAALRVLALIKQHLAEKQYRALPMTTNTIAQFWQTRRTASAIREGSTITVNSDTPILLQLPTDATIAALDGASVPVTIKQVNDGSAALVFVPAGSHTVTFG